MKLASLSILFLVYIIYSSTAQIHIKAVGDVMPGTIKTYRILPKDGGQVYLDSLKNILKGTDITLGNLEGVFITETMRSGKCSDSSRKAGKCFEFGMPEFLVNPLKYLGFTVFGMDNNHCRDFGDAAYEFTKQVLKENNISYAEQQNYLILDIKKTKVAIVPFSFDANSYRLTNIDNAREIIRQIKSVAPIIIVYFHGGTEGKTAIRISDKNEYFLGEDRGNLISFSKAMIDEGASAVIGHGPHVLRAMEIYKGKLIAYSLGNFLTYGQFNISGNNGIGCILDIFLDEKSGKFLSGKIIPTKQRKPGIPYLDKDRKAINLIKKLSDELETNSIIIDDDGNIKAK